MRGVLNVYTAIVIDLAVHDNVCYNHNDDVDDDCFELFVCGYRLVDRAPVLFYIEFPLEELFCGIDSISRGADVGPDERRGSRNSLSSLVQNATMIGISTVACDSRRGAPVQRRLASGRSWKFSAWDYLSLTP
jgi:hypothetical protein